MKGRRGRPRKEVITITTQRTTPITSSSIEARSTMITPIESSLSGTMNRTISVACDQPETSTAASDRGEVQRRLDMEKYPEVNATLENSAPIPAKKGMKLDYIAPVLKNGIHVACLDKIDVELEAKKWNYVVILYVIGESPTIRYLRTFFEKQFQILNPQIFYHADGYFIVRFQNEKERDLILAAGPHTIANQPVIVKNGKLVSVLKKKF
ncbi:hypothetical protein C2S51_022403 [Perilla frutescens var. frutescens]|nr:hypothetical protein C2S51_022403 [Perilla frutescens var. frutescens]